MECGLELGLGLGLGAIEKRCAGVTEVIDQLNDTFGGLRGCKIVAQEIPR
jgi:hypothetical protein